MLISCTYCYALKSVVTRARAFRVITLAWHASALLLSLVHTSPRVTNILPNSDRALSAELNEARGKKVPVHAFSKQLRVHRLEQRNAKEGGSRFASKLYVLPFEGMNGLERTLCE